MKTKRGLLVHVLRSNLGDSTNGGVTASQDQFILIGEDVKNAPFEVPDDEPYLVIIKRNIFGKDYMHAEPYLNGKPLHKNGEVGPMAGGNFVETSDSRFPNAYPISVHDRFETQRCYNAMSV